MTDPLGNVVRHALTGPQLGFARLNGGAARYQPDVAPFAALPDEPDPRDWRDLAELMGDEVAVLFRPAVVVGAGWSTSRTFPCLQMVMHDPPRVVPAAQWVELGAADVPEMIDLVRRTEPGPFLPRTIDLGRYIGVRVAGHLVSMAGERMRVPGATELSAVCTDPDFRGRGYSRMLLAELARSIRFRGDLPFLHVVTDNEPALALYRSLGMTTKRETIAYVVAPPGCTDPRLPH